MWPFSRKKRKDRSAREAARAGGRTTGRSQGPDARRLDALEHLDPAYVAPEGYAVWDWLKTAPRDYFVEAWPEYDPMGYEDYSKWPRADAPKAARAIRRHVLELILEASAAQYPQEFGAMLRAEKGVIEELVLLPGTVAGDSHAIFQFHMAPIDLDIVGTIHSHPSPIPYPSAADTELFERHGRVHIITGHPFTMSDWNAFDHRSHKIELKILD